MGKSKREICHFLQGKAHGKGTVRWLDGSKLYSGHLKQNLRDGPGRMDCVDVRTGLTTTFEGTWKSDQLEGKGKIKYLSYPTKELGNRLTRLN